MSISKVKIRFEDNNWIYFWLNSDQYYSDYKNINHKEVEIYIKYLPILTINGTSNGTIETTSIDLGPYKPEYSFIIRQKKLVESK